MAETTAITRPIDENGFGPLGVLRDKVRERPEAVTADYVSTPPEASPEGARPPGIPETYLRVSCCNDPRRIIIEDGDVFRWDSGPDKGDVVGTLDEVDEAAAAIIRSYHAGAE